MNFNPKVCDVDEGELEAVGEEMLDLVSRISGMSGDMEAHFNNSAKEFSELIADDILATASDNQGAWGDALTACWHIFGICKKWCGEVDRYRQNIAGLQEEWDSAVASNFGHRDSDDADIIGSRTALAESLNNRANTYWQELEGQAEDNTSNIEGGPTVTNLRELIDAGVLGFAVYNSSRQLMFYPSTEGNAEEHAEELEEYINGAKEPDAHYYHLLAQLATINGLALDGQRTGTQLRPDQIDYLEEFYATLDGGGTTLTNLTDLVPTLEANEAFSNEERDELMEALGGGLLALSDGGLGGGYDYLPDGVREVAEGHGENWERFGGPGQTAAAKEEQGNQNWLEAAENLGDLLQSAPSLEGQQMTGGTAFSTNLTVSISEGLGLDYPEPHSTEPELNLDDHLQPLLDVATRNPEANAVLLTGETTNGNSYSHPNFGDIDLGETLGNLYQHDWDDNGSTVAQITDWIPDYANSDDPDLTKLAGESSAGLIEAISSDNDLYLELIGVELGDGPNDHNLEEEKTSFTELNPGVAESFFGVFHTYIEDFGGEVDGGTHEYNASEQHLNLDAESRSRFMQYIAGDEDSAVRMIASVEAQQMENLSFNGLDPQTPEVAGSQNGTLQGLLDTALQNEAMNRTANSDEAEIENTNRQREAATLVSDLALAAAKAPADTNPVTALGADMLEAIIQNEIQSTVERTVEEDIGDFAEARGETRTPEADTRRDASLYIINQLVESGESELDISDLKGNERQSLALVGEDEDERLAAGSHEVYSRDRSTLDSGLREILESESIPPGQGNSVPADEFVGNYTKSHKEQYDDIVDNLHIEKPSDIAELAGRTPN